MDHREAIELLPWHANRTLQAEEQKALQEHLSQCEACRSRLESLQELARSMSEMKPQEAELAGDFFARRLNPLVRESQAKVGEQSRTSWIKLLQRRIQSHFWWILGPAAALLLLAFSPLLVRSLVQQFSQPAARLLLAEAPRPGIAAVNLKAVRRNSTWPPLAVSSAEDYKGILLAVSPGPDDPQYSKYIFRLFQNEGGPEELSEAETEAADQVALYLKVSGLQAGRYVLRVYGKTDAEDPDPAPIDTYPFEVIRE